MPQLVSSREAEVAAPRVPSVHHICALGIDPSYFLHNPKMDFIGSTLVRCFLFPSVTMTKRIRCADWPELGHTSKLTHSRVRVPWCKCARARAPMWAEARG